MIPREPGRLLGRLESQFCEDLVIDDRHSARFSGSTKRRRRARQNRARRILKGRHQARLARDAENALAS